MFIVWFLTLPSSNDFSPRQIEEAKKKVQQMDASEQREYAKEALEVADKMTNDERYEWCLTFLPHFWQEDVPVEEGCKYVIENWAEVRAYLNTELQL